MIQMSGISKSFSGNQVLNDVSFELANGEIHALMGENGAGKSTLMKILSGIHHKDSGHIRVDGEEQTFKTIKDSERCGIHVIHQELNILPDLSVAENLFLGKELTYGFGIMKRAEMRRQAHDLLCKLGLDIDPKTRAGDLSVGKQQLVEIAKAIADGARAGPLHRTRPAAAPRRTRAHPPGRRPRAQCAGRARGGLPLRHRACGFVWLGRYRGRHRCAGAAPAGRRLPDRAGRPVSRHPRAQHADAHQLCQRAGRRFLGQLFAGTTSRAGLTNASWVACFLRLATRWLIHAQKRLRPARHRRALRTQMSICATGA